MRAPRVTFSMLVCYGKGQGMVKLYKGSIFVITETQFVMIKTKLHGTSTCGCNNNAIFSGSAIFMFPGVVLPAKLI